MRDASPPRSDAVSISTRTSAHEAFSRVPMDGLHTNIARLALRVVRARLRRDRYGLRVLRVGMILLGAAASLQSLSWPVFQCCSWQAGQQ